MKMSAFHRRFCSRPVINFVLMSSKAEISLANYSTTSSLDGEVLTETIKHKIILTLNRPKALNALNLPMIRDIYSRLKSNDTKSTNLVIMKSMGIKAFCAGGDVVAVSKSYKEGSDVCKKFFLEEYRLNYLIGTLKMPYVAIIDGITMGGGCGLSINGKFRVSTERTLLAMPETALGLFPDVGATHFLSKLNKRHKHFGLFLGLTGYRISGADVLHAGLATHYIDSKNISKLIEQLLNLSSTECTLTRVDELLKKFEPSELPPFSLDPYLSTIEYCFGSSSVEQIFERLSADDSDFAKDQLTNMRKMSPSSLKVTFRQINDFGSRLNFSEVFPLEYRMVQRFLQKGDLHEGVRAILIDKDRNPKWNPSRIEEVTDEEVDKYFSSFDDPRQELSIDSDENVLNIARSKY